MEGKITQKANLITPVKSTVRSSSTMDHENSYEGKKSGKKRKREDSESSIEDVLPDNTLEMEKKVHDAALKNNLDDISVRKILKKVVTNDHVLALVKLREEEETAMAAADGVTHQPKLTRAKAKELRKMSPSTAPWNLENLELTPIKHIPVKTRPEVTALIAQDLPEDEDDEEYEPTNDDIPSDDEHTESCASDIDSQPRTPATPHATPSPRVHDGPFKVPMEINPATRRRLNIEEEATIALRTRSKLSLSATPIEHIESSFVPPDDVPLPDVDDLWNQFVAECFNPPSASRNEDDDETDPEYSVAADPDANEEDEEALENTIIKISKKELNDLVTELFHIMPDEISEKETLNNNTTISTNQSFSNSIWEGKREPMSDEEANRSNEVSRKDKCFSIGKIEPLDDDEPSFVINEDVNAEDQIDGYSSRMLNNTSVCIQMKERQAYKCKPYKPREAPALLKETLRDSADTQIEVLLPSGDEEIVLPQQIQILQQQLRQHIQLATSNFLQLFIHPEHWSFAPTFKKIVESLDEIGQKNRDSVVNVCNLKPAKDLIYSWERSMSENTPENKQIVMFIKKQIDKERKFVLRNNIYTAQFHETFKEVVTNSTVFLYPYLLPPLPFRADLVRKLGYVRSEDHLIAMGLDEFWKYVEANPDIYKPPSKCMVRRRWGLSKVLELVCKYMLPFYSQRSLAAHIARIQKMKPLKRNDLENPIKKLLMKRELTPVQHELLPYYSDRTLYDHPYHEMPIVYVKHMARYSEKAKNYISKKHQQNGWMPHGVEIKLDDTIREEERNNKLLPEDFTRIIVANRKNLKPKPQEIPKETKEAKIIIKTIPTANDPESSTVLVQNVSLTEDVASVENKSTQNSEEYTSTAKSSMTPKLSNSNETSKANTSTVNSSSTPIMTTSVSEQRRKHITTDIFYKKQQRKILDKCPDDFVNKEHCACCHIYRKIIKSRQTTILDYFSKNRISKKCPCKSIVSPQMTNRLKLLSDCYKTKFLKSWLKFNHMNNDNTFSQDSKEFSPTKEDYAHVVSFQTQLFHSMITKKPTNLKPLLKELSNINPYMEDQPIKSLMEKAKLCFSENYSEVYREFIGFLTARQADEIDMFWDYFTQVCLTGLSAKINEQVTDTLTKRGIFAQLKHTLMYRKISPCDLCCSLLRMTSQYSELAKYIFSLFPHVPKENNNNSNPERLFSECSQLDESQVDHGPVNYEADHSSSGEDESYIEDIQNSQSNGPSKPVPEVTKSIANPVHDCPPNSALHTPYLTITKTEVQEHTSDCSDSSMFIASDEESTIKEERDDWTKEEDKIILEFLKQSLNSEPRKEKTFSEIVANRELVTMLSNSLTDKSALEIKERISYLLHIIVLSKK